MKYLRKYWDPTPKKMRIAGDTLLAFGTAVSTTAGLLGYKWVAIVAGVSCAAGKFLTNFASIKERVNAEDSK